MPATPPTDSSPSDPPDSPESSGSSVSSGSSAVVAADSGAAATDFRGSRRLVGAEEWFWYLVAAVSYILLGIWHKWLLNWFVGPVWLVAFIVVGPWLTDRLGATGRTPGGDEGKNGLRGRGTPTES